MYDWEYVYPTRQAACMKIKPKGVPRLKLSQSSFRWKASKAYNSLPTSMVQLGQEKLFKSEVNDWIMKNVPFKP